MLFLLVLTLALLSILFGVAVSAFLGHTSPLGEFLPDSASLLGITFALLVSGVCGLAIWAIHEWFSSSGTPRRKNRDR